MEIDAKGLRGRESVSAKQKKSKPKKDKKKSFVTGFDLATFVFSTQRLTTMPCCYDTHGVTLTKSKVPAYTQRK
jgi:hypothetical protein